MKHINDFLKGNTKRLKLAGARSVIFLALFLLPNIAMALTPQEEYDLLIQQNQQLNGQVNQKKSEANTLSGQISTLNSRISQTQAEINNANAQLLRLENDIKITEAQIVEEELKLKERQAQLGMFIQTMYEENQQSKIEVIMASKSFSEFVDRSEYLEQLQLKVRSEVEKITEIRDGLKQKTEKLAQDKIGIEATKNVLLAKQADVLSQRSAQRYLLSMTQAEKAAYEQSIASNNSRKGVLWCIINGCNNGSANGDIKVVNSFSPYYSQLDYSDNYVEMTAPWNTTPELECWDCSIRNYGCLITSLSMVRSYFGTSTNPVSEALRHTYTRNGYMNAWDFAGQSKIKISKSQVRSKLEAGRPVIVELDLGDYHHFIALFAANGDTFYANDPAFGKGHTYSLAYDVVNAYSY